jgi:hypothetical protein
MVATRVEKRPACQRTDAKAAWGCRTPRRWREFQSADISRFLECGSRFCCSFLEFRFSYVGGYTLWGGLMTDRERPFVSQFMAETLLAH